MANNERKSTWPQIRDALEVNENCLLSAWLTGSFVNPTKEVTRESDIDVVLAFESFGAMDEFEYDGRYPETIEVGGIIREIDLISGGLESDYDDSESGLFYIRTSSTQMSISEEFAFGRHNLENVIEKKSPSYSMI
jgi:hypothetical protein